MEVLSKNEKTVLNLHQLRSRAYIFAKTVLMGNWDDSTFVKFDYLFFFHKFPNLRNPKTFSEKLQWLKVHGHLEQYANLVDKYLVRDHIAKTIGEDYLIPLLGVWEKAEDIDFSLLPIRFVIKTTHGSHQVIICENKDKLDISATKETLNSWLKEDFYKRSREQQYKYCTHKIICEKYLTNSEKGLTDYKFYCFDGEPYMIMVVEDRFKRDQENYSFVDLHWNKLDNIYKQQTHVIPEKPENLDKMIETAKILSKGFPFVRVDLYSVKERIYFGELTFIPSSGLDPNHTPYGEILLGDMIKLPSTKNS